MTVSFRDDVDSLISGGEFEFPRDGLRDLVAQPDVFEFAGVFRFELEEGFDEFFEEVAFLFFREMPPLGLDVLP
jgi:hypothetical protein